MFRQCRKGEFSFDMCTVLLLTTLWKACIIWIGYMYLATMLLTNTQYWYDSWKIYPTHCHRFSCLEICRWSEDIVLPLAWGLLHLFLWNFRWFGVVLPVKCNYGLYSAMQLPCGSQSYQTWLPQLSAFEPSRGSGTYARPSLNQVIYGWWVQELSISSYL